MSDRGTHTFHRCNHRHSSNNPFNTGRNSGSWTNTCTTGCWSDKLYKWADLCHMSDSWVHNGSTIYQTDKSHHCNRRHKRFLKGMSKGSDQGCCKLCKLRGCQIYSPCKDGYIWIWRKVKSSTYDRWDNPLVSRYRWLTNLLVMRWQGYKSLRAWVIDPPDLAMEKN